MSILDLVKQNLTPELIGQLSSQLGASKDGTQSVVAQAVPVLVSALAKNAQTTSGARSLDGALAKDHDGSVLDNTVATERAPVWISVASASAGDGGAPTSAGVGGKSSPPSPWRVATSAGGGVGVAQRDWREGAFGGIGGCRLFDSAAQRDPSRVLHAARQIDDMQAEVSAQSSNIGYPMRGRA